MSMQGKIIALTGGASGIGLATAKLLAARGATVCICDISPAALASASEFLSAQTPTLPFLVTEVDVAKRADVDNWIASIVAKFGRLDGAANCAGIIGRHHGVRAVADLDDDEWDRIMSVNLRGMMYSLRAELRVIVDGGSIVNISSVQGVMGFAKHGAYSASKHGVIGLTRCAAKEVGERGIRVNVLAPGSIQTPLLSTAYETAQVETFNEPTAIKRVGTADEMAAVIGFLLGPDSTFVTGSVYGADGGWDC